MTTHENPIPGRRKLQAVIVGYGHAGRDLHHRALQQNFGQRCNVIAVDPQAVDVPDGSVHVPSLDAAIRILEGNGNAAPDAVFHIATPPESHLACLEELIRLGARKIIIEKPLALRRAEAARISDLGNRAAIIPVSVWPWSRVTAKLNEVIESEQIGKIEALYMEQSKPRFARSLASAAHPSAFEVELPHQLLLALRLAGPEAGIISAFAWPMRLPHHVIPAMGGALLTLRHSEGAVVSTLLTDLTSPVRRRHLRIRGTRGEITADYPLGAGDLYGQLQTTGGTRVIIRDEPITQFMKAAYSRLLTGTPAPGDLSLHVRTVDLLETARDGAMKVFADDLGSATAPPNEPILGRSQADSSR